MRKFYLVLTVLFVSGLAIGQSTVPRVPVYEVFSSSTCAPCRPANQHLTPIFEEYEGEIAVVKYQMSWPGAGDPYYTSEGNSRRNVYGINSIPYFVRNAQNVYYSDFTASDVDDDLSEEASMQMDVRYMIDTGAQSIRVRARYLALNDFTDGGHRLMIPIIEHLTTKNKESNGESEFHNVFKKMLPGTQGELIIGQIEEGDSMEVDTTYVFQGDYRLPFNASDQIDHETEHSVEEFEDLHVIMFMQSLVDKEIYQGAIGVREYSVANMDRPWGADRIWPVAIEEHADDSKLSVYPNPAGDYLLVAFNDASAVEDVRILSIKGEKVFEMEGMSHSRIHIPTIELPSGIYILEVKTHNRLLHERIVVRH